MPLGRHRRTGSAGYRTILPKVSSEHSTIEPLVAEPNTFPIHPHLHRFEEPNSQRTPDMFDLELQSGPDSTPACDVDFAESGVGSDHYAPETLNLPEFHHHEAPKAPAIVRRSSPRSIYWWERTVNRLKAQNETLNRRLLTQDAILFQRNAEWIQLCEENRTLRTDIKILRHARDALLQEVRMRSCARENGLTHATESGYNTQPSHEHDGSQATAAQNARPASRASIADWARERCGCRIR
jgi:hypothetical protein